MFGLNVNACGIVVAASIACFAVGDAFADHQHLSNKIGVAYPTDPPPLASLEGILGTKPGLDDLEAYVLGFEKLAFRRADHTGYPWILKFSRPVWVNTWRQKDARQNDDDRRIDDKRYNALLLKVVSDLSSITGLPIYAHNSTGDVRIIATYQHVTTLGRHHCFNDDFTINDDGSIDRRELIVAAGNPDDFLADCFYWGISVALGLHGDPWPTVESMFSGEENDLPQRPTWHDVIMLRTLYDQRLKPGMPERQASPIVRVIITELLEELNAVAELGAELRRLNACDRLRSYCAR